MLCVCGSQGSRQCVYGAPPLSPTVTVRLLVKERMLPLARGRQTVRVDGNLPEDTHTQAAQARAALIERQALLDIFRQCGWSSLESRRGWGSAEPVHTWEGVRCDRDGRVVRLNLSYNYLRGAK
jgi:hypothetical protein